MWLYFELFCEKFDHIVEMGNYVLIRLRGDFYQVECGILWLHVDCFVYAWSLFDVKNNAFC